MSIGIVLLILAIILLVGALPRWPHSREWGYAPSGLLGTVLLIILILVLMGVIGCTNNPSRVQPQEVIAIACQPSDAYVIERCAEGVGDAYETYQKRVHEIVTDPSTPENVKETLKRIDRELTPAVRVLLQTSNAYVLARNASLPEAAQKRAKLEDQLATVRPRVQKLSQP